MCACLRVHTPSSCVYLCELSLSQSGFLFSPLPSPSPLSLPLPSVHRGVEWLTLVQHSSPRKGMSPRPPSPRSVSLVVCLYVRLLRPPPLYHTTCWSYLFVYLFSVCRCFSFVCSCVLSVSVCFSCLCRCLVCYVLPVVPVSP